MVQARAQEADQETGQKEAEAESAAVNINQSLVSRLMEQNESTRHIAEFKAREMADPQSKLGAVYRLQDVAKRATAQFAITQQTREDLRMTVLAIEAIESASKQAAPNTPERATSNAADKTKESYGQQTLNAIERLNSQESPESIKPIDAKQIAIECKAQENRTASHEHRKD